MDEAIKPGVEAQFVRVMLDEPDQPRYADDLVQTTGLNRDAQYPALIELDRAGLVIIGQGPDERAAGRTRRMTFRLNPDAIDDARIRVTALNQKAT